MGCSRLQNSLPQSEANRLINVGKVPTSSSRRTKLGYYTDDTYMARIQVAAGGLIPSHTGWAMRRNYTGTLVNPHDLEPGMARDKRGDLWEGTELPLQSSRWDNVLNIGLESPDIWL